MGCIEGTQFDGHGIIFAQAVFKQCTTQNETAIIFPKEEFMAAYYSASLEAFRKTNSEEVVGVLAAANLST